jgi:hypothetical protein
VHASVGGDRANVVQSPPPPTDAGTPTPEVCNDRIDNDCNGLVDCADPACSAKTKCEPSVTGGWTLVAYDATATGACPAGYGNASDVVSLTGGSQPATCGCTCGVNAPPSCVTGTVQLYTSMQPPPQCPIFGAGWNQTAGACVDLPTPQPSKPGSGARVTPLAPQGGSCTATTTAPPPPPPPTAHGRVCTVQGSLGGGCTNGGVCAPSVSGGFAICVQQAGDVACPPGYPTKTVVGTSVQDTRACSGTCGCAANPTATCTNALMSFFANAGCTGHQLDLTADDKCDTVNDQPNNNYNSWKYQAVVQNASCGNPTSTPTPTGGVSLQGTHTICCP